MGLSFILMLVCSLHCRVIPYKREEIPRPKHKLANKSRKSCVCAKRLDIHIKAIPPPGSTQAQQAQTL